jgi:hypothetical protein
MSVYVVMVCDRHHDPDPCLFSTKDDALAFARETARSWLIEQVPPSRWLYLATHESEGDSVWVIEKEIDDPRPEWLR